ncbi:hypothetical protein C8J57DRAFT_1377367 [Mycena rebaudengoi]|nr:hypothetical protein C8J57DRAFT_1377367 [Mycena rebaudengoi]
MNDEFKAARDHFMDLFGEYAWQETSWAAWMRCSTGRLALDISSDSTPGMEALRGSPRVVPSMRLPLFGPDLAQTIISSLSLNEYHAMTMFTIFWSMPDTYTARLGGLMLRGGSQYLTYPTVPHSHISSWESSGLKQSDLSTLPNGWTRVERSAAAIGYANLNLRTIVSTSEQPGEIVDHWLSQAGCILKRLHITSDFENYAIVDKIVYRMEFNGGDTDGAPSGHLFLCPSRDFQAIDGTFQRPAIPAFWALNEDGSELLAPGDAEALGFPAFQMIMHAFAQSWPQSSYDGLREFHRGKGFDPDSQDVARHLGYPLYEMFPDYSQGFAHVDEMLDCSEPDDEDRMMVD